MNAAIDAARGAASTFPFNFDDQIGGTELLNITRSKSPTRRERRAGKILTFSGDDAFYEVFFIVSTSPLN